MGQLLQAPLMTQSLATRTRGSRSKMTPSSEDGAALERLRQDGGWG